MAIGLFLAPSQLVFAQSQWQGEKAPADVSSTDVPNRSLYIVAHSKGGDVIMRDTHQLAEGYLSVLGWPGHVEDPDGPGGYYAIVFVDPKKPLVDVTVMIPFPRTALYRRELLSVEALGNIDQDENKEEVEVRSLKSVGISSNCILLLSVVVYD